MSSVGTLARLSLPYTFRDKIVSKIYIFDSNKVFVLSFHTEKKIIERFRPEVIDVFLWKYFM